jgi:hypothetical protein
MVKHLSLGATRQLPHESTVWIVLFFLKNRRGPGGPLLKFIKRKPRGKQPSTTKTSKGREGQDRRSSLRNKKGDKENYTSCSNHNSISGKYFFLALQRSCLKLNLKISRPRRLLAGIPLKIVSFLTDQMLQHMMMIISIKNLLAICLLKLSNLCSGSGELITVSPIRPQHSLARLHSRNR